MLLGFLKDIVKGEYSGTQSGTVGELAAAAHGPDATDGTQRLVLNVGGNSRLIQMPSQYDGWKHVLLDIDPRGTPDIVCDARLLTSLPPAQFDAVYCSHNLEHYYRHDVAKVLAGFRHVLKGDGFIHLRVPDMAAVMKRVVESGLDIEDILYESSSGPIHVIDVIYGWGLEIECSGNDFYAHKTGFTEKSLSACLRAAGFAVVITQARDLEIAALAFKSDPPAYAVELFQLS